MDEGANAHTPGPYLDDGEHRSVQTRAAHRPQSLATLQPLDMHLRTGRLGMREHVERLKGGKGLRAMWSAGLDAPMLAIVEVWFRGCLLYTSDAADEEDSVDLGGRAAASSHA